MTKIISFDSNHLEFINTIGYAADVLKKGGTVVFPTETVYGLGANALDDNAVRKIFTAKGRPTDNPLIVHIWNIEQVNELVSEIPSVFIKLAEKFWPGPLTIVMKRSGNVSDAITAGLDTIGIRMPNHPIALELLKLANIPVAAPSANISGSPSPTEVEHVIKDLQGKVDVIIDGGDCSVGLESTVLDITGDILEILRPGGVTAEQIIEVLGQVKTDKFVYNKLESEDLKPKSPGVKYKHYSPKAKVVLVEGSIDKMVEEINRLVQQLINEKKKVGILATEQTKYRYLQGKVVSVGDRNRPETIAANFFKLLRYFDDKEVEIILIEAVEREGIGMAIMNRMIRASDYNIINV